MSYKSLVDIYFFHKTSVQKLKILGCNFAFMTSLSNCLCEMSPNQRELTDFSFKFEVNAE